MTESNECLCGKQPIAGLETGSAEYSFELVHGYKYIADFYI